MPPGRPIALRSPSPFESDGCDRGSEDFPAAPTDGTLSCFRRDAWEPVIGLVPSRGSGSSLVGGLPGVRTASAQDYFKRRARNWRACRLRVNALASRPGRSRFAACVRALRQGVACAEVSWGGPAERCGRVFGRPSRACPRIVSPSIERPRAPICLWFTVPEAEMHEHVNNRVRSVRNRVVNPRESGGL